MNTTDFRHLSLDAVRAAIAAGAPIDALEGGLTHLGRAISSGKLELATVLLDAGANPSLGTTPPLATAYSRANPAAIALLVSRGADVRAPGLMNAGLQRSAELALDLLERGGSWGDVSLERLVKVRGGAAAQAALWDRAVAELDPQDLLGAQVRYGGDALGEPMVTALLARGASLAPSTRPSPLHVAVAAFRVDAARVLRALGASINTPLAVEWLDDFNEKTWSPGLTVRELFVQVARANIRSTDLSKWQRLRQEQARKMSKVLGVDVGGKTGATLEKRKKGARAATEDAAGAPAAEAPAKAPAAQTPAAKAPAKVRAGWRRFEHPDGRFWEISARGTTVKTQWGRVGEFSRNAESDSDTPAAARRALERACAEKTGGGYREVGAAVAVARDEASEAAIERAPDDRAAYEAYARWLSDRGAPLGALIEAQLTGGDGADVLTRHAAALLGPLTDYRRDKVDRPEAERSRWKHEARGYAVRWSRGFMTHLELRFDDDSAEAADAAHDLAAVLRLPTARFLRSFRAGPFPPTRKVKTAQPAIDALVDSQASLRLRELYLTNLGKGYWYETDTGDFGAVHTHFPKLQRLTLNAGKIQLGRGVQLPELTELSIQTHALTKRTLTDVLSLEAPELERLSLWFGRADAGANATLAELAPLLEGARFPKLRHLGLMNCEWVGAATRALAGSALLPRLTSLDLSLGCLSDDDVRAMQDARAAFAHLEHLNLHANGLSRRAPTEGLARAVSLGKQDAARAARHAAEGE